jgi:hypothetical protein
MGKHRYAPSTQRFAEVTHEPCIYAAELSNGVVKVGSSSCARARMISLATEVRRCYGAELQRVHVVTTRTTEAAFKAETMAVRLLRSVAAQVPGKREFFTGITFERAVELLQQPAEIKPRRARARCARRMHANNTSGYAGVWFDKCRGTFVAQAQVDGRRVRERPFATPQEAHAAYLRLRSAPAPKAA